MPASNIPLYRDLRETVKFQGVRIIAYSPSDAVPRMKICLDLVRKTAAKNHLRPVSDVAVDRYSPAAFVCLSLSFDSASNSVILERRWPTEDLQNRGPYYCPCTGVSTTCVRINDTI